jgi:putative ABC transport system permease protein
LNVTGNHPESSNEIALCLGTAENLGKSLGDTVTMEFQGYQKKFQVSGIYQDISSFGQGFRMHRNAYLAFNPLFEPHSYGIQLEEGITTSSFERLLLTELGETVSVEGSIEQRKSIIGLISNLKLVVLTITIIFSGICLLLISNEVVIQTKRNDLLFAQLKCIGFTSRQLRQVILFRILTLFLFALLIGLPIGFLLVKPIAYILASSISLAELPLVISGPSIGMAYSLLLLFVLFISWFSSRLIKGIDPKKLADV